jgi:hypothetical protein
MPSDPADSLYDVLPAEFVEARNALAKSLKAQGHRAEADRVSGMVRPTASVWASNQVARRAGDLIGRLADVTGRLQGGIQRDRDRYAAAINEHRELLNQVRDRAEAALADGGLRVTPAVVAAAVQNFRAGLIDEAVRPLLEAGRLEHDVGLEGGGGLFGMTAVEVPSRPAPAPAPTKVSHADRADGDREREHRQQERALAKARAEAERRLHALRRSADAAGAARAKYEAAVEQARRQLENAERALASAAAAERDAAAACAAAEAELQKLRDGQA